MLAAANEEAYQICAKSDIVEKATGQLDVVPII
jgi:hypothetical protein